MGIDYKDLPPLPKGLQWGWANESVTVGHKEIPKSKENYLEFREWLEDIQKMGGFQEGELEEAIQELNEEFNAKERFGIED